jgi:hypothetical protein
VLGAQTFGVLFALAFGLSQLRIAAHQVGVGVEQLRHGAEQARQGAEQLAQGTRTFETDVYDRRVDRVYGLHAELTTGEMDGARRRMTRHIFAQPRYVVKLEKGQTRDILPRLSRQDMREGALSSYSDARDLEQSDPGRDTGLLLRFFERARMQQLAGSVDDPVFVELIGRHAAWFNSALKEDNSKTRRALMELGMWADRRADELKATHSYLSDWGQSRLEAFGSLSPWVADEEAPQRTDTAPRAAVD